ncbi:putative nuclear mRNA splicing factor [Lophium mytilinum]|uniref:Putative nuclear mRNA splicing factor n=1 Tax=Lophium mytilinum TaxID=390894 RepID=A0A6A6QYJ4_9PEZI|nr:putative nuclear mRNA splicing factor [Lophium mytilinum]
MASVLSSLCMYSLTLSPPSATTQAIAGDFAGLGRQQILSANGSILTIFEVSRLQNGFIIHHTHDIFGIIRGIASYRPTGAKKDFIIVSSDSGRVVALEYDHDKKKFEQIHLETFGKSGVRRVIPGQYLVTDPKGRACMLASVEKNKLVWILNRVPPQDYTISSPLEAHKPQTLVYALLGLDVGYENPVFAALEVDYSESEQDPTGVAYEEYEKQLVYYQLDLGLNHVVRLWADTVDRTSHILFRVPGGVSGPSGALVCGVDNITYRHMNQDAFRVVIPRRLGATEDPKRRRQIVAGTMYSIKGGGFFYLLQTEDGDLFKVALELQDAKNNPNGAVKRLKIKYFDTVPVASSLCLLRSGFLFVACENGSRILYELEALGDDDDDPWFDSDDYPADPAVHASPAFFQPRPLRNLNPVETMQDLNPIMAAKVVNLSNEDAPQIYTLCGTGARSSLKTVRNSLAVLDLVESQLPQSASAVWTTKMTVDDEHDSYIVLSLVSMTLVLSIGEDVEEVTDSGFMKETTTLAVQQWGPDNLLQIHARGIRHINSNKVASDWHAPQHRTITTCATNNRQVAIALSSGEIYYFECDSDGALAKSTDESKMDGTILCLGLGQIPEGRVRSDLLAVGTDDQAIQILSLVPDPRTGQRLKQQSIQLTSSPPCSLAIMSMKDRSSKGSTLYLHVGLTSGIYIRTALDELDGTMSEIRKKFLGHKPVKIVPCVVKNENAILILTSRPWLGYSNPNNNSLALTPISYLPLESAWTFSSSQFKGMIGIHEDELRIFAIDEIRSNFTQDSIPLTYTPHRFVSHNSLFYVIERENHTLAPVLRQQLIENARNKSGEGVKENGALKEEDDEAKLPPENFGYPYSELHWSSCIEIVDPVEGKAVLKSIELDNNEAAISIAMVPFDSRQSETFLAVGTGKNIGWPDTTPENFIRIYRLLENGQSLELVHKTKLPKLPLALLAFKGVLAVGLGSDLALYDMGMKQLLRKSLLEKATPTCIMQLHTQGSRIVCADQRESLTYVVHKEQSNRLIPFVDDSIARYTTCSGMTDYETTIGGDKFGNIWMLRCPQDVSTSADEEGEGIHLLQKGYLGGTPNRFELLMHYFTQDIPMAVQKTPLTPGGEDVIFWAGLQGTLGVLVPFGRRKDLAMFQELELAMRKEDKPLAGRDHLAYRGYYSPVKGVVDGDLCERFLLLSRDQKQAIAVAIEGNWPIEKIEATLWTMRGLLAF